MRTRFEIAAATALASPKDPARNQDRACAFRVEHEPWGAGVVVCDGVGAYAGSGDVAERVALLARAYVIEHGIRSGIPSCAQHAADALGNVADGATTLIAVGADDEGYVSFTYVGNGSLLDITIDTDGRRPQLRVAEMTSPHVSFADGRPALSSYLPAAPRRPVEAASGVLHPAPRRTRLLLACSDGVATGEDRTTGVAADGSTWIAVPRPLAALLADLAAAWEDVSAEADRVGALASVVQTSLDDLAAADLLDDDATVGVVLVDLATNGSR